MFTTMNLTITGIVLLGAVTAILILRHRVSERKKAVSRARRKGTTFEEELEKLREKGFLSLEFSKRMLFLYVGISIVLIAITVIGTFAGVDVTAIAALAGTSLVVDGTWGGFYLWKSKNENRAKYAQKFVTQFAEEHGIDAAIRLAEVVLKD